MFDAEKRFDDETAAKRVSDKAKIVTFCAEDSLDGGAKQFVEIRHHVGDKATYVQSLLEELLAEAAIIVHRDGVTEVVDFRYSTP